MIIDYINPSEIILQIIAQNPDGSSRTSLDTAKVRVYHITNNTEIEDLTQQDLSFISNASAWRYIWEPTSLDIGAYFIEFELKDENNITAYFLENLIIQRRTPTIEEMLEEFEAEHGAGSWTTAIAGGTPVLLPGGD